MAEELGTVLDDVVADPIPAGGEAAPASLDAPAPDAAGKVESFIDPATLPEELKPHWKRMHRAYTKDRETASARKADLDLLDRFRSDPAFAQGLIQAEAQRLGLRLAPVENAAAPPTQTGEAPPATLVAAIKSRLTPELQWMADSLAAANWEASRLTTQPMLDQQRKREQATRQTQWEAHALKLTESAPGWEEAEDDMTQLLTWLRSPELEHPRFGSKLAFLYDAITKGSAAKASAIEEMRRAGGKRSSTGQPGRTSVTNIAERVRTAKTTGEAMAIAAEEARAELARQGVSLPA